MSERAVLISIQPKWVDKIARGEKTIEVRKTKPNLQTKFKCYIYETQSIYKTRLLGLNCRCQGRGKVIGEFVCDRVDEYRAEFTDLEYPDAQHKKVCQNTIKRVEELDEDEGLVYRYETSNEEENPDDCKFLKESCLTFNEARKYIGETFFDKPFFGWHISDLKIYDKPKELSEFKSVKVINRYHKKEYDKYEKLSHSHRVQVTYFDRPPQSWCYVEPLKENTDD